MQKFFSSIYLLISGVLFFLVTTLFVFWQIEYARYILFTIIGLLLLAIVLWRFREMRKKRRQAQIVSNKENRKKAYVIGVIKQMRKAKILELNILDENDHYTAVCYADAKSDNVNPGTEISVYVDPSDKFHVIIPEKAKVSNNESNRNQSRWLSRVPVYGYSLFLGAIAFVVFFVFNKPPRQLVTSCYYNGKNEQIWALYSTSSNFNNNSEGTYILQVYSQPDGKKIKKIKRELSSLPDLHLLLKNNSIWVIGSAYENRSLLDIYDATTFELKKTLLDFVRENDILKSGISQLSFPFLQNKTDLMYGDNFEIPNNRIIAITTNQGETCYIDVETGVFYQDTDSLLLDFCLAGYNWKGETMNHMYFLTYTTNKNMSTLYRMKLLTASESDSIRVTMNNGNYGQTNQNSFNNVMPVHLYNEDFRSFTANGKLEKFSINTTFYNAKIIFCDKDVVCILHTDPQNSTHYITCLDHDAKLISKIDLSMYEGYKQIDKLDIKPYSDRSGMVVGFRIKYFGTLRLDLTSNKISYMGEKLFHHSELKRGFILLYKPDYIHYSLYYSDQPLDSCMKNYYIDNNSIIKDGNYNVIKAHIIASKLNLPNAKFLYQDEKIAVILSVEKNESASVRLIGVDKDGKYLFVLDGSKIPNYEFILEDIQLNYYNNFNIETEVSVSTKQATIVFNKYGSIAIDLASGQILWTHEFDLNRGN